MRVVFVCLGNICRSPLAEGILRHMVVQRGWQSRIQIDSAGTGAWHAGEPPDHRSASTAQAHGVSLDGQRARQVVDADYFESDWLIAMDESNLATLQRRSPTRGTQARLELLMAPPRGENQDVPDPYYGEEDGFDQVLDMLEEGCPVILQTLMGEGIFDGMFEE